MPFHVARNGQTYGPYTREDLERYVASGHVLPTDSVKSDDMPDWIPVAQLLNLAPAAAGYPPPAYANPAAYGQPVGAEGPPDLNWGLVLLFDVLTCSLFQHVWNIIVAVWFRRVYPTSKALPLYIASAVLILLQGGTGQAFGIMAGRHGHFAGYNRGMGAYGLIALICWVIRLIARFTMRAELERYYNTVEPIGLRINPVLTFFFGGLYHQSVLNRINGIKRGLAFGALPR